MYSIPTSITVDDKIYKIRNRGDYRTVLDCFEVLEDVELEQKERLLACLMIFFEDFNELSDLLDCKDLEPLVHEMFVFFSCGDASEAQRQSKKLMDWKQDSQLICAAVNTVAHMEVRAIEYLHWWTFMGYYMSIGESLYSTIISIRDKIVNGKKLEKYEKEFKSKNPQYFMWNSKSVDQKEAEQWVADIWNSGK